MTGEWPPSLRVGFVGGTRLPGNVGTFLRNVRRLLADHPTEFACDLLLREGAATAPEGFDPVDPGIADTGRALGTIRTLAAAATAYARRADPDVLFQVTKFPVHGLAATVAGRRTDTPVLARLAGDNFREHALAGSPADRLRTLGLNNVLGRAPVHLTDRIVVLGPHGRKEIRRRSGRVPVAEIPQPVDRDRFSPVAPGERRGIAAELGFPRDRRVLLSVGRATERKGMDAVVATARRLHDRGVPFAWYVLGEGPLRPRLAAIPDVHAIGRVPHDRMPDYYRGADLLVHPSRIEGLPNVLLEAAACGIPSVARDVGDCARAASAVFSAAGELPGLVTADHAPVDLDPAFDPDRLRNAYADAIATTARGE